MSANDYQARKDARRQSYLAAQGVPQPRQVFRVYAAHVFGDLPERFGNLPIGGRNIPRFAGSSHYFPRSQGAQ